MKYKRECSYCKKMLILPKYRLASKHSFCNRECKSLWQKSKKNDYKYKIKQTMKQKKINEYNAKKHENGNVVCTCFNCNKKFIRWKSQVQVYNKNFCNRKCNFEYIKKYKIREKENNSNWKGGISFKKYPKDFFKIRKNILKRDNYKCFLCGNIAIDVHHIEYDKNKNNYWNLISLCRSCHMKTNGKRKYWKNILIDLVYQHINRGYAEPYKYEKIKN